MKNGTINRLAHEIHEDNKRKGFYDRGERNIGEMLALIHSEVSEALECDRKGRHCEAEPQEKTQLMMLMPKADGAFYAEQFEQRIKDTWEDELADVFIRLLDLAAYTGVDLDTHVFLKMKYNRTRLFMHGKKY